VSITLPSALRAITPIRPNAPLRINTLHVVARFGVARLRGGEVTKARFTAIQCIFQDFAMAHCLATVAMFGASRPLRPLAHFTVLSFLVSPAAFRFYSINTRVARRNVLERKRAWCSLPSRVLRDESIALLHSEATAAALGPFTPAGNFAINVFDAWQ